MNIINRLKHYKNFTYNENFVVNYILKNLEKSTNMTIYELAKQTNTSTSTIVRLSKKCGFEGFKEFKIALIKDFDDYLRNDTEIDANTPFHPSDTDLMISNKIAHLTSETVKETQKYLTTRQLNYCVDLLLTANNINAIGVSDCFIKLKDFQLKLLRINKFVRIIDSQAEQFFLANYASSNDVVIIVSYSGKTAEIINDAKYFHQNNASIIAITADEKSPLASYATELLLLPKKESSNIKVSNFSSQISIEYILNVLYSCIYNRNYYENYNEQKSTPISSFKDRVF